MSQSDKVMKRHVARLARGGRWRPTLCFTSQQDSVSDLLQPHDHRCVKSNIIIVTLSSPVWSAVTSGSG